MAQLLSPQISRPREQDPRSQAAPVVVCPLEPSCEGQHAAAVAASLSRGLGWRLTLVPVEPTPSALAAAAADAEAALVVVTADPAVAETLAGLVACPVVVVPRDPRLSAVTHGPLVCALDSSPEARHIASTATRYALALGSTLRLIHTPQEALADVPDIARKFGATLLIASSQGEPGQVRELLATTDIPVMLIPATAGRLAAVFPEVDS